MIDPREAARFMNRYARRYNAGAFGSPTAPEIALAQVTGRFHELGPGALAMERKMARRVTTARDWTGRDFRFPARARVITHVAVEDGAAVSLRDFSHVHAYMEDAGLTRQLGEQGFGLETVKISAASEIIGLWRWGASGYRDHTADAGTLVELPPPHPGRVELAAQEVTGLAGWADDYPFYSDGTWGALSLRGFYPEDPAKGVKPTEMNRKWKAEHPDDLARWCGWTTLAERCPHAVAVAEEIGEMMGAQALERVRFLRMAGKPGGGKLGRHTDITDKSSGTRDGHIVRVHVPLLTHASAEMIVWNLAGERHSIHLPRGTAWYLDARKPHAVVNHAAHDERVHLVVDLLASRQTRAAIMAGKDWAA